MATNDDFQQRSDTFMYWLKGHEEAKVSSKIALRDFRSRGRGRAVFAIEDISNGELLFEIPRRLVMDAKSSNLRRHISSQLKALEPWQQIVLVMIYEFGKGEGSRWYPYLQVLPDRIDHVLVNWSDEELRELQGSAVLAKIGKEDASRELEATILPVVIEHPDLFGTYAEVFKSTEAKNFLLDLAHRMAGVMMAYAFDLEEDAFLISESDSGDSLREGDDDDIISILKGMVPLADMLNASGPKHNASISYGERELIMHANKPIKAGDEIFNTYGDLPRSDLLRRYGYINDDYVAYDVIEISTTKIIEIVASKFHFDKKEIGRRTEGDCFGIRRKLERLLEASSAAEEGYQGSIFEDAYDIAKVPASSGAFPLPLLYTIWLLVVDDAEVATLKATRSSEPKFTLKVAWVLKEVLAERQKDYATSIDEDRKILEQPDLRTRLRLAVDVRLGEKLILHEALEYFHRINAKLPGGLENWKDKSLTTTYLLGEELLRDEALAEEREVKKRRLK